jgi:acyl carrier protein
MSAQTDKVEPVRRFIIDNFLFGRGEGLSDEQSFLDSGIIDSTGILELVMFLEETYGLQVNDEELIPDNLDSVNKISAFLQKKGK